MKPLISVISVNYNGYALTCAMVESLRRHVTSPLEIIVCLLYTSDAADEL